jgi:hypothetical protein
MAVSLVSTGVTFPDNSTQTTAATGFGFKNRIINGAMVIDQRNAGASVTLTSGTLYTVDRFGAFEDTDGGMTAQQSSQAPEGFTKSLLFTTTSADASLGATQSCVVVQRIEGNNTADLGWGTALAKTVTLSFWVRSSLTGTFSGSLMNSAADRSYPFTYTISSANTWEQKSVTVSGDTSGTWLTDNGIGIRVHFSLGSGSSYSGTAGAWATGLFFGATGATSVIGTNGATFYITGVQLEKGSTATSFDYRPYGTELALCQRYFYQWSAANAASAIVGSGQAFNATQGYILLKTAMTMRVPPVTFSSAGSFGSVTSSGGGVAVTALSLVSSWTNENMITLQPTASGWASGNAILMSAGADAACRLNFSAEL